MEDKRQFKFCQLGCEVFKLPRMHHCSSCQACCVKYDHHCGMVQNCIGVNNYHLFLQMICLIFANFSYAFGLNLYYNFYIDFK